jgi:AcrR family transcriptional regulator
MTALADPVRPAVGVHERAVEAALVCIARHGLGKTTIDDVAREAGCSRATLYRYFDGKAELLRTVVRVEVERIAEEIRTAADDAETLEDAVVAMLHTAGRELGEHPALRFVADFEPERLLPHLTFAGGDRFLGRASDALAPCLERFVPGRGARAAEWIARVGLTLWMCPHGPVSLSDTESLRAYVRAFVVPALDRPASDSELELSVTR